MAVLNVTSANFENEVLKTDATVIVDFWASWCAPCRMMSPVIEEIAKDFPHVKVCKINVDENPSIAEQYNVSSIPTILIIKNNDVVKQYVGVTDKFEIEKSINLLD